ncbi:UNVERIFIED_CONTAM: hypothetical protein Cloal_0115 [Acetivibrio alkalicellulosi]
MEKQYFYRRHIRKIQKTLPIILGIFATIVIISSALIFTNTSYLAVQFFIVFIGISFTATLALTAVISWVFLGRFVKISVTLKDNVIIYKNVKGVTEIPIDQIQHMEFPSIKFTGGWLKIKYPGGNIRLTVVLERIGDFLNELKTILDRKGMQNVYNRKAMFSFYKTAEFSDQSWDRMYEIFKRLMLFTFLNTLLGTLINLFIKSSQMGLFYVSAIGVLPLIIYLITEVLIANRMARKSNEERFEVTQRDYGFEKKVYKRAFISYIIGSVLLLALYYYVI